MSTRQPEVSTERLRLRRWREEDREWFAALSADPAVMEFYPSTLTRAECDEAIDIWDRMFDEVGYGMWAVELLSGSMCIGTVGLNAVKPPVPFAPAVEAGWRLARAHWGHGYATEAARATLRFGFEQVGLEEITSYMSQLNRRSQRVMESIGMTRDPSRDFEHPRIPEGHPLRPHVVYALHSRVG